MYVANLASQQKNYSEFLFHILERLYKLYAEPMILNAICTLLIIQVLQKLYYLHHFSYLHHLRTSLSGALQSAIYISTYPYAPLFS